MGVSIGLDGLWLSNNGGTTFVKNTFFSNALMFSFGKENPDSNLPSLFVYGVSNGQWGIYRSDDFGGAWVRINDQSNYVGNSPTYMKGCRQSYGRVYVGTNGSGIFYGEIISHGTDLIITDIKPEANNRYQIVVKNQGGSSTGLKWIGVLLYRNGSYVDWGGETVDLAAGATTTFTTREGVTPIAGSWTAMANVDYNEAVAESDESNNWFSKTIP